MNLVPFAASIPKGKQDPKLAKKLKAEWPAILAWAVEGCQRWQEEGLKKPEAVADATEEYLAEQELAAIKARRAELRSMLDGGKRRSPIASLGPVGLRG